MIDFPVATIEISTGTAYWGPFSFDFSNALPSGDSFLSATVKSTGPDGKADTTANLIDGSPAVSGNSVSIHLKYPGDSLVGKHMLRFTLTLASGGAKPFEFGYVLVEK